MPIAIDALAVQLLLSLVNNMPWLIQLLIAKTEELKEDPDAIRKAAEALKNMPLTDEILARYGLKRD